jgi:hypothetical protein
MTEPKNDPTDLPFSREYMLDRSPSDDGVREVMMLQPVWEAFVNMVYDRGLGLFPIPSQDPDAIPSYAVMVSRAMLQMPGTAANAAALLTPDPHAACPDAGCSPDCPARIQRT